MLKEPPTDEPNVYNIKMHPSNLCHNTHTHTQSPKSSKQFNAYLTVAEYD